ncbi:MAG: phosphoenolpyruvate carboxylase, partial [Flavobacteriales bacterium]|nr:phosphoenolpyruvate carboxylase [Flavobacteriales bacterium]
VIELTKRLEEVADLVQQHSNGLYIERVRAFLFKLRLFGLHFASMDIRQDSRVIQSALDDALESMDMDVSVFRAKSKKEQVDFLFSWSTNEPCGPLKNERHQDVLESLRVMRKIQGQNGERACHRFIISNCRGVLDVAAVYALTRSVGTDQLPAVDIVPLFETIADLDGAHNEMQALYAHPEYSKHLEARGERQTVMLGFSDGTKDGGYLRANWAIYQSKQALSKVARDAGITVLFFDGRGGPPARGGGNTHRFYASLGKDIENVEIQTTIQGQTISSNFGIPKSAGFNLELLLTAGLQNRLFEDQNSEMDASQAALMDELGELSYAHYETLKSNPQFMNYLKTWGTLLYYGQTNIGSRPTSRKSNGVLSFDDLRAIPFVGSWTQLKQNVPGFYGLGMALEVLESKGRLNEVSELYASNLFFKALIENSMQSMLKSDFRLTAHLADDPQFGAIWRRIKEEFDRTKRLVLKITGQKDLMELNPHIRESIALRDGIIRPLLVIQHFALGQMNKNHVGGSTRWDEEVLRRLVVRSMYGIINASRNAV